MGLQERLKSNTGALFHSLTGLSEEQSRFKPTENTWSVLECLEHIFIVDASVLQIMNTPAPGSIENTKPELFSDEKPNKILLNRFFKYPAPDLVKPKGKFKTISEAVESLNGVIDKINFYVSNNVLELETHTVKHPALGQMTKTDWIHFLIHHTNRHVLQIEEVKKAYLNRQ